MAFDEAAAIDDCGRIRTFFRIILPVIVFLPLQKYLIQGMIDSAVKQ